jgi:chromosome segregation ATPase
LDLNQVTQLLTWLDEEHRKDKALLMALQSQIDTQKAQLTEQARQLQEIQAALPRIEGQLPRLTQLDAAIQSVRSEFSTLLAKHAAEQDVREETRTRSDKQEAEALARIVRQVQERVESIASFDSIAAALRDEDSKLRGEITRVLDQFADLNKGLAAQDERLDLLAQDGQGFRDGLTALRLAHEDWSNNKHMALKSTVEALGPRLDTKIEQLQLTLDELSKRQQDDLNALQLKQQEWDRRVEELSAEMKAAQPPVARWTKQLEDFANQFERNRKTLYDLRELERQIRQQGNEVLELQRLAAERQRTELREWQDNQVRLDEEQAARLERLESWQKKMAGSWQSLEERLEQNHKDIEANANELWQVWSQYLQAQAKVLDATKQKRAS